MSRFFAHTRYLLTALVILILVGIGAFSWQVWGYYRSIKSGVINPLELSHLESTVSTMAANQHVTKADLDRLVDPSAPALGSLGAPVTIVEFLDYGCPFCRASFEPVREMVTAHPDDVRLVIRDFPVEELHPGAVAAAIGARCAQEQGKFWAFHDKLYLMDRREFSDSDLALAAQTSGLNVDEWNDCKGSEAVLAKVRNDVAAGLSAGVAGTPTFFFNGVRIQGALDRDTLKLLVDTFKKRAAEAK